MGEVAYKLTDSGITQQVILADALRASEERYRRISNAVSDYIYHIPFSDGRRGKIIPDTNSEIVTGYRADELVTMSDPTRVIVHPEDWPEIERKQNALVADIDVSSGEYRIVTKQGETRWVSHVLSAQRDQSGKLVGYDGILRDITDKKIAQLTLRNLNLELDKSLAIRTSQLHETAETVKLLATAMNSLLEGVIIAQRSPGTDDYAVVFANKAMSAMSGYKRRELVGKSLTELRFLGIASDSASAPGESPDPASQSRHSQLKSVRLTADDGRVYDTEVLTSPIYAADGGVTHLVAVYRDISARKVAELELHRRNEQIKAILDTVADAIITIDIEGDIRDVNHITSGLFGYTSQELLGSNITKLLPSVIPGAAMSPITIFAKKISSRPGGQYREYTAQRKDRSSMPIGLNIREIDDSGLFTCVIRDLTLVKSLQRQILDVVEEENRRIGRELHDSIQQQLVGIRLLADSLLSETDEQSQTPPQPLSRLLQALDHTIGDLRILCRGMVSIDMDGDGLRAALSQLATGIEESNGIRCSFNSTGKIILKTPVIAGHIYRIAQEAVTNALKHANARAIAITLCANAGRLILEVCDDGIGIRDEDLERGGMGLQIMYYRAGLISGNLKIYCLDTGGTRLICSVPVSPLPLERSQGEIWGFFL